MCVYICILCLCKICIYIYIYMRVYIHTYVYIYIYIHTCIYIYIHIHTGGLRAMGSASGSCVGSRPRSCEPWRYRRNIFETNAIDINRAILPYQGAANLGVRVVLNHIRLCCIILYHMTLHCINYIV